MIEIEEIAIKLPGFNDDEAHSLAEEVARQISAGLPIQQKNRNLEALDLRLSIPTDTSGFNLAKIIAEAILKGLI